MASWSKLKPEAVEISCSALAHPWTESCLPAIADTFFASCIGSTGFFSLINFCQYVSIIVKKKKKVSLKDFLRTTLRSAFFTAATSAGTLTASCFLRNLLGRYYYYTLVFIPALIGGLSIYFESEKGREFATNAFANLTLESWIKKLQDAKTLNWTPNHQTIIFMILSSVLSSLLSGTNYHQHYYWFFIPPKIYEIGSKNICIHKGDCWKHGFKLFIKYSTTGLVLQVVRLFVANIKNPKSFISSLISPKIFKLAAFLGTYVFIYEVSIIVLCSTRSFVNEVMGVRCFFYRKEKKLCLVHDTLAGFLAGAAFRFQPTLPILNSGIITIVQVLAEIGRKKKFLPDVSYTEMIFVLCCGFLFHERLILSDQCTQMIITLMSAITNKRCDGIAQNFQNAMTILSL